MEEETQMNRSKFKQVLLDNLYLAPMFTDKEIDTLYEGMDGANMSEEELEFYCIVHDQEFLEVLGFEDEDEFIEERGGK